eukprot:CAMPEP_0177633106 /NCGR_PEP_ID=MMETSP0447-20121125/2656_1 /TAXON_ID=0 /ORGANISM="Stygamoeba regulata, Strain BSH-02190019" /LENGTH=224 /DNA_ID=CAMNT_0019134735 /DNA_START=176 /DNA_END=847 /DNA_ORIENTATION=+
MKETSPAPEKPSGPAPTTAPVSGESLFSANRRKLSQRPEPTKPLGGTISTEDRLKEERGEKGVLLKVLKDQADNPDQQPVRKVRYYKPSPPAPSHVRERPDEAPTHQPPNPHVVRVALLGPPNAGKSTILNGLVGQHVAAVSRKSHTTQAMETAVTTIGETQIVFVDTPGVVSKIRGRTFNSTKLERQALAGARTADVVLLVLDAAYPENTNVRYCLQQLSKLF